MELPQTSLDKLTTAFKDLGVQAPNLLTKIGILRSLIIEIESAKKDGYSYGLILETLIANSFKKTTLNQFYGLINRIRLERGFTHLANQPVQKIAPAAPVLLDDRKLVAPEPGPVSSGKFVLPVAKDKQQMISMEGIGRPRNLNKPQKPV